VCDVVGRLLPNGTRPLSEENERGWSACPQWPPDAFAVTATLLERSGIYSQDRYSGRANGKCLFGDAYRKVVQRAGAQWRAKIDPPASVRSDWRVLCSKWDDDFADVSLASGTWWDAVVRIFAAADEASLGFGFVDTEASPLADVVVEAYARREKSSRAQRMFPYLPYSLCRFVPAIEACVQPKSRTSQVGCTLRALSHHLALAPPVSEVRTAWYPPHRTGRRRVIGPKATGLTWRELAPLNLLVVPFPYRIDGNAFAATTRIQDADSKSAHFRVRQTWLHDARSSLGRFLKRLISEAEAELGSIHGLVMPELAIDGQLASRLAGQLTKGSRALELFITGVALRGKRPDSAPRNVVFVKTFRGLEEWTQAKHHRWRLDRNQICRYHLGHQLDPDPAMSWWEEIDVGGRSLNFVVFRPGASVCTLICEDLARSEPVQPILRAIGPNLVVALLMDGPQLEKRWPGKYATVLAEDPGSAVLTVSSLGMVQRSSSSHLARRRSRNRTQRRISESRELDPRRPDRQWWDGRVVARGHSTDRGPETPLVGVLNCIQLALQTAES
jgi:hypothetical protein